MDDIDADIGSNTLYLDLSGRMDAAEIAEAADEFLAIPDTHPVAAGLLANVQLQLVSYRVADLLGRSIDKPRNLAKSVTVE